MRASRCSKVAGGILAMLTAVTGFAHAGLLAEWNFDSTTTNREYATYTKAGISSVATLYGNATSFVGTAFGAGGITPIQNNGLRLTNGYYTANGGLYLNQIWSSIFGVGNFSNGTVMLVLKPDTSYSAAVRYWFFQHNDSGVNDSIGIYQLDGVSHGVGVVGGRGSENSFGVWTSSGPTWNTNDWYFIAGSWKQSSGSNGVLSGYGGYNGTTDGCATVYVRTMKQGLTGTLKPAGTTYTVTSTNLMIWNTRLTGFNYYPYFGRRTNGDYSGSGDYALIRIYNEYMDAPQLANLFDNLFIRGSSILFK